MNLSPLRHASLAVSTLCLTGTLAFAMPGDDKHEGSHERMEKMEMHMKMMEEKLDLTPEQKAKMDAHRQATREEARKTMGALREKRQALAMELEKETYSVDTARKLHGEFKTLQAQAADQRFQRILEVRQILTTEQFKKMHEFKKSAFKDKKQHGDHPKK